MTCCLVKLGGFVPIAKEVCDRQVLRFWFIISGIFFHFVLLTRELFSSLGEVGQWVEGEGAVWFLCSFGGRLDMT